MMTYTRKARLSDLDAILKITDQAVAFLASQDSPQWQGNDGPTRAEFETAINAGVAYVLIYDKQVAGVAKLISGPEAAYDNIDGQWNGDATTYMTIHRVTVDGEIRGQGLAQQLLHDLIVIARERNFTDIRIDTQAVNAIMQHVITKLGFTYQGMIMLPIANGERKAYQLILD
ncbi:GNAT family N-acetyltransferase [Weissella cibaria]|uniref:GNAT family N-acetyltransferase n=1 Tax=Weissella cibaria TaxID=137591 RepID=UPI001CC7C56F|nr:GNAT family N-acetyltransferase [Weissella cibaria]MBZ6068911.1 GNAT family N-acetyltransferase [Weissella cibaria]